MFMKTPAIREAAFREDLAKLLEKHGAVMEITEDGESYGMQSGIVIITMRSEWDDNNDQIAEFTEFRI